MGKVITVWGSPGSGKSMFSCILAKALTRDKRKAIIINAEISVPMLPVWLPEQIIQTNASVGQVLSSVEIDTSLVAGHVTVLKSYPFIGVMGYAAGENPLSYPEVKYAMVLQLVNAAARLVDFVILDCSSNMTNVFTPAAIESGDLVIRILTPDLKGVNYLKAHQPLLGDGRFHYDQHMTFAGMARPFHALDEMGHIIGGWDGLLPYGKEIDRCATEGGMFQAIKYCNPKYTASLNKVLDALEQMELADHAAGVEHTPDHINGVLWGGKLVRDLNAASAGFNYLNVVVSIDVDLLNTRLVDPLFQEGVPGHVLIELLAQLLRGQPLDGVFSLDDVLHHQFFQKGGGAVGISIAGLCNRGGVVFRKVPLYIFQNLFVGKFLICRRCEENVIEIIHRQFPPQNARFRFHHPLRHGQPAPSAPAHPKLC